MHKWENARLLEGRRKSLWPSIRLLDTMSKEPPTDEKHLAHWTLWWFRTFAPRKTTLRRKNKHRLCGNIWEAPVAQELVSRTFSDLSVQQHANSSWIDKNGKGLVAIVTVWQWATKKILSTGVLNTSETHTEYCRTLGAGEHMPYWWGVGGTAHGITLTQSQEMMHRPCCDHNPVLGFCFRDENLRLHRTAPGGNICNSVVYNRPHLEGITGPQQELGGACCALESRALRWCDIPTAWPDIRGLWEARVIPSSRISRGEMPEGAAGSAPRVAPAPLGRIQSDCATAHG